MMLLICSFRTLFFAENKRALFRCKRSSVVPFQTSSWWFLTCFSHLALQHMELSFTAGYFSRPRWQVSHLLDWLYSFPSLISSIRTCIYAHTPVLLTMLLTVANTAFHCRYLQCCREIFGSRIPFPWSFSDMLGYIFLQMSNIITEIYSFRIGSKFVKRSHQSLRDYVF